MEYTVNQQNIQKYAERLTNDLCRQFFVNKAFISGPEILTFNTEQQLNLLIVKNIYLNWQKEALKLKSSYFDYEDEEVKQALKTFMNKLSNHIKVYRYDFEPLVTKSICDLILLAAAPQDFFTRETEALASPKIPLPLLKEFSKYIRINRFVMEQVVREIEASGYTETFGGETIRFILKAINENPEKIEVSETALKGLLDQLPADVTDFVCIPKPMVTRPAFLDQPRPEPVKEPEFIPVAPPKIKPQLSEAPSSSTSEPEAVEDAESVETTPEVKEEISYPSTDPEPASEPETDIVVSDETVPEEPEPIAATVETTEEEEITATTEPEPLESPVEPIVSFGKPAKNKLAASEVAEMAREPITLNDTLRQSEQRSTLADSLQIKTVSAPFKTLVPMHYRFTFINSLFAGNQQIWAEAVDKIDKTSSYEEAVSMLKADYAETYSWDKEEDNVGILFNYIERKF
jgi:hypothetical protein